MNDQSSPNILHIVCDPLVEFMYNEGSTEFSLGRTPIRIHFTTERDNDSVLEVVSVNDPVEGATILLRPLHPAFSALPYFGGRGVWKFSDVRRTFMAFLGEAAFYSSLLMHRSPVKMSWAVRDGVQATLHYIYRRPASTTLEKRIVHCKTLHSGQQIYPVQPGSVYGVALANFHPLELHIAVLVFDSELRIWETYRTIARRARALRLEHLREDDPRREEVRQMQEGKIPLRGMSRSTQLWRSTQGLLRFTGKISCIRVIMSTKPLPPWKELLEWSVKPTWDALTLIGSHDTP